MKKWSVTVFVMLNLDLSNELPPEEIYERPSKVVCVSAPALTGDPVPGIIASVLLGDITDPHDQVVFNSVQCGSCTCITTLHLFKLSA